MSLIVIWKWTLFCFYLTKNINYEISDCVESFSENTYYVGFTKFNLR